MDDNIRQKEFQEFKGSVDRQFTELRNHFDKKMDRMNEKLDKIFDPNQGYFLLTHDNNKAVEAAHKRIDSLEEDLDNGLKDKIDKIEAIAKSNEKFVNTAQKIVWRILTPLFAALGVGLIILILLALPKITQTLDLLNRLK